VLGGGRAVRAVRLDAPDVLAASQGDGVRKRAYVCPDVDDDVGGLETFRQYVLIERDDAVEDQPIERAGSEAPPSVTDQLDLPVPSRGSSSA
jgi:hypothetical protein